MNRVIALAALVVLAPLSAGAGEPPKLLGEAPPNTWVRICAGAELQRASAGMVWVPGETSFVLFGGAMKMWKKGTAPYTEMTLNLAKRRWENRFPRGKLGVWGERTGPSNAPGFPGRSYYRVYMKDKEGTARPYLGSGYDRAMFQYHNYAWDSDREVAVVVWHWGKVTAEYDPAKRTWRIVDMGEAAPPEMWDDFLWGAMCYDPVNKEVLGGQGRWAYQDGTWRRLEFGGSEDHERIMELFRRTKDLAGRCRSRFYHAETAGEAKTDLAKLAAKIREDAAEFAGRLPPKADPVPPGADLARRQVQAARDHLDTAAETARERVAVATLRAADGARDALERAATAVAPQPPRRAFSARAYDAANQKIVMFGGDRLDARLADTWVYDCKTRTWRQRFPRSAPPPRAGHGLVWLPKAQKLLLVGGYGLGRAGRCWTYDTAKNEWAVLAEPTERTFGFTPTPRYSWFPGPVAANGEDLVVLTRRADQHRGPKRNGTWAAKIDAKKTDPAAAVRLGVPPLTMRFVGRDPLWYDKKAGQVEPGADRKLADIPANTWVRLKPPNNPRTNRAWGTTVLDTRRDQLLQYGGGHAAYCGTDVLHYSIETNRCSTGSYRPDFTLNWNGSMLGPPIPTAYSGRPHAKHGYRHYGFDRATGKMIWYSGNAGRFFVYDPATRDWKGTFGKPVPKKYKAGHNFIFCNTPRGLAVWASPTEIWWLDNEKRRWKKQTPEQPIAGMRVDCHSMACDSKRNRLLFFFLWHRTQVASYDLKTGDIEKLEPASGVPIRGYCREATYVPNADLVFMGKTVDLSDGKTYWLCFDCSRDAWIGVRIGGPEVRIGVGTGIEYDPKRKLIWTAGARMGIAVVRLDLDTAAVRDLEDEPPPKKEPKK
ncbi:MAG: kelch repeat-containing protein [Planctomycetota bacterium]